MRVECTEGDSGRQSTDNTILIYWIRGKVEFLRLQGAGERADGAPPKERNLISYGKLFSKNEEVTTWF